MIYFQLLVMRDIIRLDGYNHMDDETFQKSIKYHLVNINYQKDYNLQS